MGRESARFERDSTCVFPLVVELEGTLGFKDVGLEEETESDSSFCLISSGGSESTVDPATTGTGALKRAYT